MRTRFILMVLALLAAIVPARAKDPTVVTLVQSSLSFNFVPLYVAQTQGYFTLEGLKVEVVLAGGGPKAMMALLGGGGQFAAAVLHDGIVAHAKGLNDARAIAALSYSYNPMVVRTDIAKARGLNLDRPLAERVKSMKGLKLAVTSVGGNAELMVRFLAISNGLSPERDFEIVPLGGVASQIAGLRTGQVDGCSCVLGVDILTKQQGLTVDLLKPGELSDLDGTTYGTLYTRASYAKANPEVVRGMARAMVRATALIADRPDLAGRAARPFFKDIDDAAFDASWRGYLPYFPKLPLIGREDFLRQLAFEKSVQPPASFVPVPYDDVVDVSAVIAAMRDFSR